MNYIHLYLISVFLYLAQVRRGDAVRVFLRAQTGPQHEEARNIAQAPRSTCPWCFKVLLDSRCRKNICTFKKWYYDLEICLLNVITCDYLLITCFFHFFVHHHPLFLVSHCHKQPYCCPPLQQATSKDDAEQNFIVGKSLGLAMLDALRLTSSFEG